MTVAFVEDVEEKKASNGNTYYRVKTTELQNPTIVWGDDMPEDLSKGDKISYEVNRDGKAWNLEEIDVMESGNKGEGNPSKSSAQTSGGEPDSSYISEDDRINKKVAFKEAAETVRQQEEEIDLNHGEHMEVVSKIANGYYNILKDMGGDNDAE